MPKAFGIRDGKQVSTKKICDRLGRKKRFSLQNRSILRQRITGITVDLRIEARIEIGGGGGRA